MTTTLKLVGGLGNQMFIYVLGRYISEFFDREVAFVDGSKSLIGGNTTHAGSSIEALSWGSNPSFSWSKSLPSATYLDLVAGLQARLGVKEGASRIFPNTYTSGVPGFDPALESIKGEVFIRGYFQTPIYFDALVARGLLESPSVANPSTAFLRARDEFRRTKPIILHMRRGDYLDSSSTGVLSIEYYKSAISLLEQRGLLGGKEIWIFSDSTQAARELAGEIRPTAKALSDHYTLSVAEELMLMAEGSSNVISNSTFSWWGAKLSTSSKFTICPKTWFKNGNTTNELSVEGWLEIESQWV